jgi:long-chain acyl-CoA synthetase
VYPGDAGSIGPNAAAVVMTGSGQTQPWAKLDERSTRLAQLWRSQGLTTGDHVALLMENVIEFPEVCWAAYRSGLMFTPINSHLTASEVAYILRDCGAQSLITTAAMSALAGAALVECPAVETVFSVGGGGEFGDYETALAGSSEQPLDDETAGAPMLYSSGTTGVPKGVMRPLSGRHPREIVGTGMAFKHHYNAGTSTRYLSPAPMYHSAPLSFAMGVHMVGGTLYMMERFDPEAALRSIETYGVTHSQWVPTMFSRMLKLPEAVRSSVDLSSHEAAVHGAAPCPVPLKRQMIDWWGPIIWEYYAGTEGPGSTLVTSEEWLKRPGTVGRATAGAIHILGDDGTELPPGESGAIYFESPTATGFRYHGDDAKTAASQTAQGWSTMGDIGYLDDDGYLFLTDRKAFMIISGGVNVYPQEAENLLSEHPSVADVAVFGVPDDDLGEVPMAVVQVAPGVPTTPELAADLLTYCRAHLASIKCPRTVAFEDELPRLPTGKLYKQVLRDRYRNR